MALTFKQNVLILATVRFDLFDDELSLVRRDDSVRTSLENLKKKNRR